MLGGTWRCFLDNINNVSVLKSNSPVKREIAKWGMTAEIYLADKLRLIAESVNLRSPRNVGRRTGWAGVVYSSYSAVVAISH